MTWYTTCFLNIIIIKIIIIICHTMITQQLPVNNGAFYLFYGITFILPLV
jgi:hypothetical protein